MLCGHGNRYLPGLDTFTYLCGILLTHILQPVTGLHCSCFDRRNACCWMSNLFLAHQQLMSFIKSTYSRHSKISVFGITGVISSSHLMQLPRCFYLFVGCFFSLFFLIFSGANSFSAPADADRTHATWVNSVQWDQNSTFKQLSRHRCAQLWWFLSNLLNAFWAQLRLFLALSCVDEVTDSFL